MKGWTKLKHWGGEIDTWNHGEGCNPQPFEKVFLTLKTKFHFQGRKKRLSQEELFNQNLRSASPFFKCHWRHHHLVASLAGPYKFVMSHPTLSPYSETWRNYYFSLDLIQWHSLPILRGVRWSTKKYFILAFHISVQFVVRRWADRCHNVLPRCKTPFGGTYLARRFFTQ